MTPEEREKLWNENAEEINKMNVSAAGMIDTFMIGIEENGRAYVRLSDAAKKGHTVNYVLVEAEDETALPRVARSLGLTLTETTIEVPHV